MATIMRPTMRALVNPNPQGSATKHVTMPAANPFEARVTRVRLANAPRDMLPGMGDFATSFAGALTGQTPGGTAPAVTPSTDPAPAPVAEGTQQAPQSFWAKLGETVLNVGSQFAISSIQTDQTKDLLKAQAKAIQAGVPTTLATPGITALPIGVPGAAPASSTLAKTLPWLIGAAAVAGVGFILLRRRKGARR